LQECLLHTLQYFQKETGLNKLCMAGGVALNCAANGVIQRSRLFQELFIQPAAGDDGSALGAALYVQYLQDPCFSSTSMSLPLWGPEYSDEEIFQTLAAYQNLEWRYFESFDELSALVAQELSQAKIFGWFQGRLEFGPRALGNRSILADPRVSDMRERVNALIKKREGFRPFAPAVCAEMAHHIFSVKAKNISAFRSMSCVAQVKKAYVEQLPAITHVDGSARLQSVNKEHNLRFWKLLTAFGEISKIPVLLNTSFNVRGQAIVCQPAEAIDTFISANLDGLVMGNYLIVNKSD